MTIRILNHIEWTDPIPSSDKVSIPNTKYWLRSDIVPKPKQIRLIFIPYYYRKNRIHEYKYLFYQPGLSSINGYSEDFIEEIDNFYIVDAKISEIACELGDDSNNNIWYLTKINRVFNLKDFQLLIPNTEHKQDRFRLKEYLRHKRSLYYCKYQQWYFIRFSDDYWGIEFILQNLNNKLILCFFNEWYGSDEDESFITNYRLTEEESNIIKNIIIQ